MASQLLNLSARMASPARLRTTHPAGLGSSANSAATDWRAKVMILHTRFRIYWGLESALRRHVVTPFAQVLLGGVWAADGVTLGSVTAFGMTVGGGIDLRIFRYFTLRPLQAEYFMTKFPDGANNRQNNFRFGAGIVLRLGGK